MDASVIIPVRNAAATLPTQLAALARQDFTGAWELVVADNGSTDDSVVVAEAHAGDIPIRVVDATARSGAAFARNAAARASRGSRLLFCDADDVVHPGWITAMTGALAGAELIGGRLELLEPCSPDWTTPAPPLFTEVRRYLGFLPRASTANLGVRRSLFEALGGFDDRFPAASSEDVDFCWRAQLGGARFEYCDAAVVRYRRDVGLRTQLRRNWNYGRGDAVLLKKYLEFDLDDPSVRPAARAVASGLRHAPRTFRTAEQRAAWLSHAAYLLGHVRGLPLKVAALPPPTV